MATEFGPAVLALLIFGPLAAGMLSFLLQRSALAHFLGIALAAILLVALVPLSREVLSTARLILQLGGHIAGVAIPLQVDGLSLAMLWLNTILALGVGIHSRAWLDQEQPAGGGEYPALWLVLWSGLNALFVSGDLFNLYVTLEVTTLAAVPLVVLTRGHQALDAAQRYLFFGLLGSSLFLLGVTLTYGQTATLSLPLLAQAGVSGPTAGAALVLMTGGLAMKAALFPVHGWLPLAHSAAPSPASALLSAIVAKAGVYLILRLWTGPLADAWTAAMGQLVGVIGALGIVYGSVQALAQIRLKRVIAYSTVAQLSYLLLLIPLSQGVASAQAWTGVLYHALTHGLAKAALFLAAGNLLMALGNDRIQSLAGCDRTLSTNILTIGIGGVAIAGLPPTGGFIAKWWMISAALEQGQWWWALVVALGGVLAAGYIFRALRHAFFRPDPEAEEPIRRAGSRLTPPLVWPPMILALLAVALGLSAQWLTPFLLAGAPGVAQS